MAISPLGTGTYSIANSVTSPATPDAGSDVVNSVTTMNAPTALTNSSASGNNSTLALAINQALAQMSGGANLSALFGSDAQQSSTDFTSSLLSSLQASSQSSSDPLASLLGDSSNSASPAPAALDQSSPTFKLQSGIQNLINQLSGNDSISSMLSDGTNPMASSLGSLQETFNGLITASGGNPSQASLQSFLQLVVANMQGSSSIGSLFDASA